jgi:hypothetical protein
LAKDAAAECRAGQKRQPQAGLLLLLADPAVAGRAKRDAVRAKRRYYFVRLSVKAVRAELGAPASVRMVGGPETPPERMDVELLERQAVLLLKERASEPKGQLARAVRLALKRAKKRLAPGAFESLELVEQRRPAWRVPQAWPRLAAAREQLVTEH